MRNQLYDLIEHSSEHYRYCFTAMGFSGMRVSEGTALKWYNVDFDRKVIKIRERRLKGKDGPVKTQSALRDIEMEYEAELALKLLFERDQPDGSEYVFRSEAGIPLERDSVNRYHFKPAQVRAGLTPIRPWKHLRHTYGTIMLDEGRTMNWVRKQMGHGSIAMLIRHYYAGGSKVGRFT